MYHQVSQKKSTFWPHIVRVYVWYVSATLAQYGINWLVLVIEIVSIYCAVRAGSLSKRDYFLSLKG
jgi:hypothetical protein